jgi:hypothetical protein
LTDRDVDGDERVGERRVEPRHRPAGTVVERQPETVAEQRGVQGGMTCGHRDGGRVELDAAFEVFEPRTADRDRRQACGAGNLRGLLGCGASVRHGEVAIR